MYRRLALVFLLMSLCWIVDCGKNAVSDDSLATNVKAKLFSDPATRAADVNVAVKDGVVTLSGSVPDAGVALKAMKLANTTAGAKRVDDHMKVNSSAAATETAQSAPQQQSPQATPAPQSTAQSPPASSAPEPQTAAQTPASAPAPAPGPAPTSAPAPAAAPEPVTVTIPRGEHVTVRTIDSIDSNRDSVGQLFRATLYSPLVAHGRVIVPAGAPVSILLTQSKEAGRFKGQASLQVRLARIEYRGRWYRVDSTIYEEQGKSRGKQTAQHTAIGAVAGAVIGAIAGGGKGAAIGSAVGGAGGAGSQFFTHGRQVKIPSEAILTFRLEAPLRITERR